MVSNNKQHFSKNPEFDSYAKGYSADSDEAIKHFIGGSFNAFIEMKVQWLLRDLRRHRLPTATPAEEMRFLDFGCGTGEFLHIMRSLGFKGKLEGCDVSQEMLKEASERWQPPCASFLHLLEKHDVLPFPDCSYDLVVACCVFHHIEIPLRDKVFGELVRILKPSGRLVIFEHNPINPVTRFMVKRAKVDKNALLLYASEIEAAMLLSGVRLMRKEYFLFFPLWFRWLQWFERFLCRSPFGGQYVVVGEKPD